MIRKKKKYMFIKVYDSIGIYGYLKKTKVSKHFADTYVLSKFNNEHEINHYNNISDLLPLGAIKYLAGLDDVKWFVIDPISYPDSESPGCIEMFGKKWWFTKGSMDYFTADLPESKNPREYVESFLALNHESYSLGFTSAWDAISMFDSYRNNGMPYSWQSYDDTLETTLKGVWSEMDKRLDKSERAIEYISNQFK